MMLSFACARRPAVVIGLKPRHIVPIKHPLDLQCSELVVGFNSLLKYFSSFPRAVTARKAAVAKSVKGQSQFLFDETKAIFRKTGI
jgi:hypothetical protein